MVLAALVNGSTIGVHNPDGSTITLLSGIAELGADVGSKFDQHVTTYFRTYFGQGGIQYLEQLRAGGLTQRVRDQVSGSGSLQFLVNEIKAVFHVKSGLFVKKREIIVASFRVHRLLGILAYSGDIVGS